MTGSGQSAAAHVDGQDVFELANKILDGYAPASSSGPGFLGMNTPVITPPRLPVYYGADSFLD